MSSFGKQFIAAAVKEQSVADFMRFGVIDHLFKANEVEVYEFTKSFLKKYGKLPDAQTIFQHTGEELGAAPETSEYYHDLLQARNTELSLKSAMKKSSEQLSAETKDPEEALKILIEACMLLVQQKHSKKIVDFRMAHDAVVQAYTATYKEADARLRMGWPTFDDMSGGIGRGDLLSMVGFTAAGKTWQMLNSAMYGWREANLKYMLTKDESFLQGASRMFISMEMDHTIIQQRMAAMHTHLPMNHIKFAALSTGHMKQLKKGLMEIQGYGAPFWIVDGNLSATVEEAVLLARQLKPDAVFIDGAYLMKHPKEHDRYRRVAENADLMKQELASLMPVVASWQFAKGVVKKKQKGEKIGLDDIGYAYAIAEVSSLVLGLFENDSIETLLTRMIEIMKGRSGEVGSFMTNWDFYNMNFDEYVPEDISNLDFS